MTASQIAASVRIASALKLREHPLYDVGNGRRAYHTAANSAQNVLVGDRGTTQEMVLQN
jgi:hypothetical protein